MAGQAHHQWMPGVANYSRRHPTTESPAAFGRTAQGGARPPRSTQRRAVGQPAKSILGAANDRSGSSDSSRSSSSSSSSPGKAPTFGASAGAKQAASITPPSPKTTSTNLLDGPWTNSERLLITIRGSRFEAETGDTGTIDVSAAGQVEMSVEGEVCHGWLAEDTSIRWSDGDVWVRSQRASRSAARKHLWRNSQGIQIVVEGDAFRTETGEVGSFRDPGQQHGTRSCSLELDGEISQGWYESDGSIRWADGDVWLPEHLASRKPQARGQSSLDQLQDMFPSWEREALADVLATYSGNLEDALNNLLQWTSNARSAKTSRHHTSAPKPLPQTATPHSSAVPAAPEQASFARRFWGGPSNTVAPAPEPIARQEYDQVLAARLSRKSNARLLGHAAKAAVHWQRKAKEGHDALRRGSDTKVAWAANTRQDRLPPSRSNHPSREDQILEGKELLRQRCTFLGLRELEMEDDGNCQFRAVSQELYGTQEHHGQVRAKAVEQLRERSRDYSAIFADGEWDGYLSEMSRLRTWGDEITLKAVSDAFKVHVHLVTSTEENWYLVYRPTDPPKAAREIFLTYVAPIHYNAIEPMR